MSNSILRRTTPTPTSEQASYKSLSKVYDDGEPRSFPTSSRHISTVPWFPTRYCSPLAHHIQLKWYLLMLLPLGKVPFTSSISLWSWGCTSTYPILTFQVQISLHGK